MHYRERRAPDIKWGTLTTSLREDDAVRRSRRGIGCSAEAVHNGDA